MVCVRVRARMETYHGLLSMDHRVEGAISIEGDEHVFRKGRGYIEKDWGKSFPSSWIWMQSNGFNEHGASLMFSTAVIPWLSSSFIGHLAIIRFKNTTINLSTYRGGKITRLQKTGNEVLIRVQTKDYVLDVQAINGDSVSLKSPVKGLMTGRTIESLDSRLNVSLTDNMGEVLFFDIGLDAGLEIMDDTDELIKGLNLEG